MQRSQKSASSPTESLVPGTSHESVTVEMPGASVPTTIVVEPIHALLEPVPRPVVPVQALAVVEPPKSMIQIAIERGVDADQLRMLMDLQDRDENKKAKASYDVAMNEAQKEMPVVVRDATNKHTGSKYARLETVNTAIKPIYTKHGFSLSFGPSSCDKPGFIKIACKVRHIGGHTELVEGEYPIDDAGAKGTANKTGIQAIGSTSHYAQRYLTLGIFNVIVADQDNDGNAVDKSVGENQIEEINGLIDFLRKAGRPVDFPRFLEWLKVKNLGELTLAGYAKAVFELNRRKAPIKDAKGGEAA